MSQFDRTAGAEAETEAEAEADAGAETDAGAKADGDLTPALRTESRVLPAEVFATLGNDTRVDILRALLELGADEAAVSFTDLFERVDVDDSANFNYHLRHLTGHFVKRSDDGYEFRYPAGRSSAPSSPGPSPSARRWGSSRSRARVTTATATSTAGTSTIRSPWAVPTAARFR